jgi:hypothetical protein
MAKMASLMAKGDSSPSASNRSLDVALSLLVFPFQGRTQRGRILRNVYIVKEA